MNDQQDQQVQQSPQAHPEPPPPNYLVWAILSTILCCLPFGIVSIVYAAQVNTKWQTGDYEGAKASSKNAKIWAWVAFGVGIGSFLIWSILASLGIIAGMGWEFLESLK
jgi:hypothetical protein